MSQQNVTLFTCDLCEAETQTDAHQVMPARWVRVNLPNKGEMADNWKHVCQACVHRLAYQDGTFVAPLAK